jgi:hypothetical protein
MVINYDKADKIALPPTLIKFEPHPSPRAGQGMGRNLQKWGHLKLYLKLTET